MKDLHAREWASPEFASVEGANIAFRLVDGRVFVGVVAGPRAAIEGTERSITIQLWGGLETLTLPLGSIAGTRTVGKHTWEERREVAARQRRGEPALLLSPAPPTT